MDIMDELSGMYAKIGEHENKQACSKEADAVETEVLQAIEKAECVIKGAVSYFTHMLLRITNLKALGNVFKFRIQDGALERG